MTAAAERLHRLAQALEVPAGLPCCQRVVAYLDAMLERNQVQNLTAIRDPATALVLHALDSLVLGRLGLEPAAVLDLGSGNGFPGVAVAALYPRARVTLLDRTQKKAAALRDLTRACDLTNVEVLCGDAAQVPALHPHLRGSFDLITARAVGRPDAIATLAEPLLAERGTLALWLDADGDLGGLQGGLLDYDLPEPAARRRRLGAVPALALG